MRQPIRMLLPAILGAAGFLLRYMQQGVFSPATGLAEKNAPISIAAAVYLAAAALLLLTDALRRGRGADLSDLRPPSRRMLPPLVCGVLLLAAGGALTALSADGLLDLVLGAGAAAAAGCLLWGVARWRRGQPWGGLLLAPALVCVVWLLLTYKRYADWPVTELYYVQVLAVAAFACAFYQVAAYGCGQGSRRVLRFILPLAVMLGLTALADDLPLGRMCLHMGCTVVLGGFWVCEER